MDLKSEAQSYEAKKTHNIADLEAVSVSSQVEDREGKDSNGDTFKYKVIVVSGEEYRVPASVLDQIKSILEDRPDLKTVKVKKNGSGMNTSYMVVPLE